MWQQRSSKRSTVRFGPRRLPALLLAAALINAALPEVAGAELFYSPADDASDPGVPIALSIGPSQSLSLYLDGGSQPSSNEPCEQGDGDEVCGWIFRLRALDGIAIQSFVPETGSNAEWNASPVELRAIGGDAITGALGPTRLGSIVVDVTGPGTIEVESGFIATSALTSATIPTRTLVLPEPGVSGLVASAFVLLTLFARRDSDASPRRRRTGPVVRRAKAGVPGQSARGPSTTPMVVVIGVATLFSSTAVAQFVPGDLNDDGTKDLLDAVVLQRDLVGLGPGISQICTPSCGDGVLGLGETCELGTLEGASCESLGFFGGSLACAPGTCTYDTAACTDPPADCDPLDPLTSCGANMRCEPQPDGMGLCLPGTTPTAGQGTACSLSNGCAAGLACRAGFCEPWCLQSAPTCPGGGTCSPLAPPVAAGGQNYGLCGEICDFHASVACADTTRTCVVGELLAAPDSCLAGVLTLPEGASCLASGLNEFELCGPNSICFSTSPGADPFCLDVCATSAGGFGESHSDCRNLAVLCQDVFGDPNLGLCF